MESSARESYLVTEVMTATPQKLQLMLIEAAIRSAKRARKMWREEKHEQACEAMIHAQQVVSELLASLDREAAPELVRKIASVYLFVFRRLMEANYERDEEKLADALRVLEVERETWQSVCTELGSRKPPEDAASAERPRPATPHAGSAPQDAAGTAAPGAALPRPGTVEDLPPSGLSLEA